MSEMDHAAGVHEAITIVAAELRPWIAAHIGEWPPDRYGHVNPNDPSYLISVMLDHWNSHFSSRLGGEGLTLVQEFRHTRNRWAHHHPFDPLEAFRAIDTCRLLLHAIGSERDRDLIDAALGILNDAGPDDPVSPSGAIGKSLDEEQYDAGRLIEDEAAARERELDDFAIPRMHRKAASEAFRHEQWERRFDPHVAPINHLVEDLIAQHGDRWMPYVAPYHGGINATVLLLFQDPGKKTAPSHGGSGFIGCENDDPSAELLAECLDDAGLAQSEVTPWNSYPWFRPEQGGVSVAMLKEGLVPMRHLLGLLGSVHTVVTGGTVAHDSWRRFEKTYPRDASRFRHLETFHTSGQGIVNGGQQKKAVGVAHVTETLRRAAKRPLGA